MAETIPAASSPAEVADPFKGEHISLTEYSQYRAEGAIPERFQAEEATTDAPEETAVVPESDELETVPESDPEETQEPPQKGSGAEKRIKQLLARVKELESKQAKPDVKPESSPAPQQFTRPKPTVEAKNQDGSAKYSTYEEYVEDLADWKAEQRVAQVQREQAEQQKLNSLRAKLDDARSRYEDADEVIFPAAQTLNTAPIPQVVKQVIADSENFVDLCYVLGSDADELKKFTALAQSNPRAALAKVFEYERGIREELAPKEQTKSGKAPEPRKTTAPKPPSPVGGTSSRAFDVSDESLSPEEWARKRTQDLNRRSK